MHPAAQALNPTAIVHIDARLQQFGINSPGHRLKLVDEIANLRKYGPSKHVHRYVTGEDLQSTNIFTGLFEGLVELLYAVANAVFGLLYQPAKGVREDGCDGLYAGIGLGLAKLIGGPLTGVAAFLRKVSEGIKNTSMVLETQEERDEYLKNKVVRERERKQSRRESGKKDLPPHTLDDDEPEHLFDGCYKGVNRFVMQCYLGATECISKPTKGLANGPAGLVKGIIGGLLSLVCRPISGMLDLVQRPFEGCINTPNGLLDRCQHNYKQMKARERLTTGSDAWWAKHSNPAGQSAGMDPAAFLGANGVKLTKADKKHLAQTADPAGAGAMADQDVPLAMRPAVNQVAQLSTGMKTAAEVQADEVQQNAQVEQMMAMQAQMRQMVRLASIDERFQNTQTCAAGRWKCRCECRMPAQVPVQVPVQTRQHLQTTSHRWSCKYALEFIFM
eukprot:SAG31_NODE_70_length_28117_cov_100.521843_21_plen_446_part_00